jgi:hypothetical protein
LLAAERVQRQPHASHSAAFTAMPLNEVPRLRHAGDRAVLAHRWHDNALVERKPANLPAANNALVAPPTDETLRA